MKTRNPMFAVVAVALAAGTAVADILGEATYYWNFDADLNGDGLLQTDEVRDVRYFGATNAAYAGPLKVASLSGNDLQPQGPTWVQTEVREPGRGLRYHGTALHFTVDNRSTETLNANGLLETNCCPVGLTFNNASIPGSVTVLMRCRIDSYNSWGGKNDHAWLVNNGEAWDKYAGSNFGFIPASQTGDGTTGSPSVYFGRSELNTKGTFSLTTNIWYDVGISLKDTGDGGAEAVFVVHDPGLDQAYATAANVPRKPFIFKTARKTYAPGSGCFPDESKRNSTVKIGAETPGARSYRGANKGFAGDLQRVVMWNRALSEDELKEAILGPSQLLKVGLEDGRSGEFGNPADLANMTYTNTLVVPRWHLMPSRVDAAHPSLDLVFTATNHTYRNGHLLRVKGVPGTTGTTWLRPTVNGAALESKAVETTGAAIWYVKSSQLRQGLNTIRLTRLESSTASVLAFDVVELTGSWFLGVDDWQNTEFSVENCVVTPDGGAANVVYYPADYATCMIQRGSPTSWPNCRLCFYVPDYQAARYDFVFSGRVVQQGGSFADRFVADGKVAVKNQYPLSISLNGATLYETPGLPNGTVYSVLIPAGAFSNGWNTINVRNELPYYSFVDADGKTQGNSSWICFDYHSLAIQPHPNGTMLMLR